MLYCKLYIKEDSRAEINKKILVYIYNNLETLIFDKQLLFDYIRVGKKSKPKGITKCPTLIFDNKQVYTGEEILAFLKRPVKQQPKRRPDPTGDGGLSSYYDSLIGDINDTAQGTSVDEVHQQRLAEMIHNRQGPQQEKSKIRGRYDSVINKLSSSAPTQEYQMSDDFQNDFADAGDFDMPPEDDYNQYAKSVMGGGTGLMA